jgi:nickel-dependent lactate racemase
MQLPLKYGHSSLALELDASLHVEVLTSGRICPAHEETALLQGALENPIGSLPLAKRVAPGQRVAVVTSDITRPCPSARMLPLVLDELNHGGVRDEDILVVFALGTHRPHTQVEKLELAGEHVYRRVRCIDSDPANCVLLGQTSRQTPVWVFRPVAQADVRVCLGNIEYHYFAGYSGGVKAVFPGVANAECIQQNHRRMTEPGALAAHLDDNPVRCDIEEAGEIVGVDFILNVILDENKTIVSAVAGHPRRAHRVGCQNLDAFGRPSIDQPADIVFVSAGGHPKDLNLYQAQKALDNARHIVRPGGFILLVAECGEGMGNRTFEKWMHEPGGPDVIIDRIRREFVLGGHKAAAVAMTMKQAEVGLVSAMPADELQAMGFRPFNGLAPAVQYALDKFPAPRIAVLPEGGSVVPQIANSSPTLGGR